MPHPALVRLARRWQPDANDLYGEDKQILIRFLLQIGATAENPKPIEWVADNANVTRRYTKNQLQDLLMVPLRNDDRVFIGTSMRVSI